MFLYLGSTSIVKLCYIPDLLPLKIIPRAISHSKTILLNDKTSTELGDKLYSSYKVLVLNPKRSHILSSNIKLIIGPCGDISTIDPKVEKIGLIVNG